LDYEDGVRFAQSIIDTFPQLKLRLPEHAFKYQMEFKGTKRTVDFVTFGGGHTDSDAFLHLPVEKIIFTDDLLFGIDICFTILGGWQVICQPPL